MKRQGRISGMIMLAGAFLSFACTDMPTAPVPDLCTSASIAAASKKPPNPGGDETPLGATFFDIGGINSDEDPDDEYVHGDKKVRAVIRTNGNLNFDAAKLKKNQNPERFLCIKVIDNDEFSTVLYERSCVDATLNTNPQEASDAVLGEMAVGGAAEKTTAGARWLVGDTEYRLKFGRECGTATRIPAHKATVTHPTADTWTLEGGDHTMFCSVTRVKGKEVITVISTDARASFHVTLRVRQ